MERRDRSDTLARRTALLQEQRYRRQFLREDGRQTAVVMIVICAAYATAVRNDLLLLPRGALLGVVLASRLLLSVATGIMVVLLRRPTAAA